MPTRWWTTFDVVDLLSHLGARCVELFDAAAAGLLLADAQGVLRLMAATSEEMEFVEVLQLEFAEGPCFDCFRLGEAVQVDDLASAGDRWPRFAPIAGRAGFRSAHAFPLRLRGRTLGALNLFRANGGQLEPSAVRTAQALADVATIAILQHRAALDAQALAEQLTFALNSRISIEQAKGVVAESSHISMDEAFNRLRGYARSNRPPRARSPRTSSPAGSRPPRWFRRAHPTEAAGPVTSRDRQAASLVRAASRPSPREACASNPPGVPRGWSSGDVLRRDPCQIKATTWGRWR